MQLVKLESGWLLAQMKRRLACLPTDKQEKCSGMSQGLDNLEERGEEKQGTDRKRKGRTMLEGGMKRVREQRNTCGCGEE